MSGDSHAATAFPTPRQPGARLLLIDRTRYDLYDIIHDEDALGLIRALWHASQGRAPALR